MRVFTERTGIIVALSTRKECHKHFGVKLVSLKSGVEVRYHRNLQYCAQQYFDLGKQSMANHNTRGSRD